MSAGTRIVLDASVGVKWFREEQGSVEAQRLLDDQREGVVALHVTENFLAEVLGVVNRRLGPTAIIPAWEALMLAEMVVHPLSPDLVGEAARQCVLLGCSFYDALAPAAAVLLGGELCSADRRAHGAFASLRVIGG